MNIKTREDAEQGALQDTLLAVVPRYIGCLSSRLQRIKFAALAVAYRASFFGFIDIYRLKYAYDGDNVQSTEIQQRAHVSEDMIRGWKTICQVATSLLLQSITLLWVSSMTNSPLMGTTALMLMVFSAISGLSSGLYIRKENGLLEQLMEKWLEASQHPNHISSVDFWACFALPLCSMLWSIIFYVATFGTLIWAPLFPEYTYTSSSLAGVAFTLVFIICLFYIYHLFKLLLSLLQRNAQEYNEVL